VQLVEDLRSGKPVRPTRGPDRVCTFKQVSRVLAGFPDGLADEGVGAGPASLVGLRLAQEQGWTAPEGASKAGATASATADDAGKAPGNTEVTPASDDAAATKAEPAATRDAGDDTPSEDETPTRTTGSSAKKKGS
jgi:NADH-quinone oxidoreductase subunit E